MIDFRKLADALATEPDIWLARNTIFPGASPEAIERAEAMLGTPLHPEVREFYQHHNGLAIEWMYKKTKTFKEDYRAITPELPIWEEFLDATLESNYIRFDGQIVVLPIEDVFYKRYDRSVYNQSPFHVEEPFSSDSGYIASRQVDPTDPSSDPFAFGERQFVSEIAFRSQLRYFDYFMADQDSTLLLLEQGQPDPTLLYLEAGITYFDSNDTCPLSEYLQRVAFDFGLLDARYDYFWKPEIPPTISFDAVSRLAELINTTKFYGDLRE